MCARFDFERAATRIGMRMTVDGSGDELISIQGLGHYTFSNADAGEDAPYTVAAGADPSEQAELDADVESCSESSVAGDEECVADYEEKFADSSGTDDDDTGLVVDTIGPAPEDAPSGFTYVVEAPPLLSDEDGMKLVGKYILHAFDVDGISGWYIGKIVNRGVSLRDLRETPTATHVVLYERRITHNPKLVGRVATTLTAETYGKSEWWILLDTPE